MVYPGNDHVHILAILSIVLIVCSNIDTPYSLLARKRSLDSINAMLKIDIDTELHSSRLHEVQFWNDTTDE